LPATARLALAGIRLTNGTAALLAPAAFGRRLGVDPDAHPPALYVMRLFGVRTILIGADLLRRDPGARARALRVAPLVHASDTAAAVLAGRSGHLPSRAARAATAISALNLALALLARRRSA
jgi:hypothetical protein